MEVVDGIETNLKIIKTDRIAGDRMKQKIYKIINKNCKPKLPVKPSRTEGERECILNTVDVLILGEILTPTETIV